MRTKLEGTQNKLPFKDTTKALYTSLLLPAHWPEYTTSFSCRGIWERVMAGQSNAYPKPLLL